MQTQTENKTKIVSAAIEPETHELLARMALAGDRTLSSEIRRAIRSHVAAQPRRARSMERTQS